MKRAQTCFLILITFMIAAWPVLAIDFKFQHHFVEQELAVTKDGVGDYGLTALVDLDRDGDLDFVLGGRSSQPSRLYWFEFQGKEKWKQHTVGTNYMSDVGLAA